MMPPATILRNIPTPQTALHSQATTRAPLSLADMLNPEPLDHMAPSRQQESSSFAQTQGVTTQQNAAQEADDEIEQEEDDESDVEDDESNSEYDSIQQSVEQDRGYRTRSEDDDVEHTIETEEYGDEEEQHQELHDRRSNERLNSSSTPINPIRRWRRARSQSLSDSSDDTDVTDV